LLRLVSLRLVSLGLAGVVLVAACGGGSQEVTTPEAPPPSSSASTAAPDTTAPVADTAPTTTAAPTTTTTIFKPPPLPEPSPALASPGDNRVYILGDSVVLGAKAEVPGGLKGWNTTLDASESRFITQGLGVLQAKVDGANQKADDDYEAAKKFATDFGRPPPEAPKPQSVTDVLGEVVVISLCTNYEKTGAFAGQIDKYMTYLKDVDRVVWVTCAEWSSGQAEANQAIRDKATRYDNIVVADWAAYSRTPGYTYGDQIHLDGAGRKAIVELLGRALGPAPTPTATSTTAATTAKR
jgi:hypothetical protein